MKGAKLRAARVRSRRDVDLRDIETRFPFPAPADRSQQGPEFRGVTSTAGPALALEGPESGAWPAPEPSGAAWVGLPTRPGDNGFCLDEREPLLREDRACSVVAARARGCRSIR